MELFVFGTSSGVMSPFASRRIPRIGPQRPWPLVKYARPFPPIWLRPGNSPPPTKLQIFFPRRKIIPANVMPAIHQYLRSVPDSGNCGRTPAWNIFSRRPPKLLAIGESIHREKRVFLHIAQHDDFVLVNNGRTGEAPLRTWDDVITRIHWTQIFFPNQLSIRIETKEPFRTKNRDNSFSIGCGRRAAMARFGVTLGARSSFIARLVPKRFACRSVKRKQSPLMRVRILGRLNIAIQADL